MKQLYEKYLMEKIHLTSGQSWESLWKVSCLLKLHSLSKHVYDTDFELLNSNSCMTGMGTWIEQHCRTEYTWVYLGRVRSLVGQNGAAM